jgi:hypothetical protein
MFPAAPGAPVPTTVLITPLPSMRRILPFLTSAMYTSPLIGSTTAP